jgi:hypothetical protein
VTRSPVKLWTRSEILHLLDDLHDVPAVLDTHREVDGYLGGADRDRDAARLALRAGDGADDASGGARGTSAHVDAVYLLRRHASYLGDDRIGDDGPAALAHERAVGPLLALLAQFLSSSASEGRVFPQ